MNNISADRVGSWSVGFSAIHNQTIIKFDIQGEASVVFAMPHEQAIAMARAILDQDQPSESHSIS